MQAAAAGTGVRLSDGSTNVLPVGSDERGRGRVGQPPAAGAPVARARLLPGLGPAPGAAADPVRRDLRVLPRRLRDRRRSRLRNYVERQDSGVLDEPATARALADFLLRGLDCGALSAERGRRRDRPGRDTPGRRWRTAPRDERRLKRDGDRAGSQPVRQGGDARRADRARHARATRSATSTSRRSLRGDFAAAHIDGDQSHVLPTDTQKNTAFAYAKEHGVDLAGGLRHRARRPAARGDAGRGRSALVRVEEYAWDRIAVDGVGHDHAFVRRGGEVRTAEVEVTSAGRQRRLRAQRPGRAEVDRLGVQGLPRRRVHDAPRGRRPHPRDLAHARPGATATARGVDWSTSVRRRCGRCCSRRSRRPTAGPCRRRSTRWDGPCSRPTRTRRGLVRRPQQAPLPGRPRAVRARQPGRGLHRGRPSLRPDRGRRCVRERPRDVPRRFNAMDDGRGARPAALTCLDVPRWADEVLAGRPYADLGEVEAAMVAAAASTISDDGARARRSRGTRASASAPTRGHDAVHSTREQSGVDRDDADVAARLGRGQPGLRGALRPGLHHPGRGPRRRPRSSSSCSGASTTATRPSAPRRSTS